MTVVISGLQGDVVYLEGPIAPSYTSPNEGGWAGGDYGVAAKSKAVHIKRHGAKINFGDLTPCLTYDCSQREEESCY